MRRRHHFMVCKIVIPRLAFSNPQRFVDTFAAPDGVTYMRNLWDGIGEREFPLEDRIPSGALTIHVRHLEQDRLAIVIEPPAPTEVPDCYFVGVAGARSDGAWALRLFTLELAEHPLTHERYTILAGLEPTSRANYGPGPAPDVDAFFAALETRARVLH